LCCISRTPPYKDKNITSPKEVFIQLERPSDSDCSEPIKFTYKPSDRVMGELIVKLNILNFMIYYGTSFFFFLFVFSYIFFNIIPSNFALPGRKRTRVSHSSSMELVQMTFNNDMLLTNTPLTNIPSNNDSADISKEIKKILDDRCSSSEFRDFVEHINLDGKCSFM